MNAVSFWAQPHTKKHDDFVGDGPAVVHFAASQAVDDRLLQLGPGAQARGTCFTALTIALDPNAVDEFRSILLFLLLQERSCAGG